MDLLKPFKKVVRKMQENRDKQEKQQEIVDFIEKWSRQFEIDRRAKSTIDTSFDEYEQYYQGKRQFGNLTDLGYNQNRNVRTVINFVRTTIEALIDLSVPQPDITGKALDDELIAKIFGKYISSVCQESPMEEINLWNERRSKKFGGGFYKVHWNNSVRYGSYVGEIEISDPHPKHIIPNAGALDWENDLEHYHHILNKTEKYILRRWPHITREDLEDKATFYEEYDEIMDGDGVSFNSSTHEVSGRSDTGLSRYSIIETTYRDDNGDICKFWWSGELLLDHIEKFYWHRDENGEPIEYEILDPGTMIRAGVDEKGEPILKPIEEIIVDPDSIAYDEETGMALGYKVDYYIPKRWDIIYQVYLPRDLSCWGTSMIDDIKDLYESALKAIYVQEESFLRGRKKILCDNEDDVKQIMDPGSEVIVVRGNVKDVDLNTNIDGINWIEYLWSKIQLTTGATNSVMGVHDPGVKSAKQAQLYVSQATYKANLASTYKAIAFKKLYRVIADFAMAFCDDDRPFRISGNDSKPEFGTFSRLSMLRDDRGNVVYPNFDINVSAQAGFMQNKSEIMGNIVQLASQKAFEPTPGNVAYLKILQKIGMPYLDKIIQDLEKEVERQKTIQEEQMKLEKQNQQNPGGNNATSGNPLLDQMPDDLRQEFDALPPEVQQEMMALVV